MINVDGNIYNSLNFYTEPTPLNGMHSEDESIQIYICGKLDIYMNKHRIQNQLNMALVVL